MIGKILTSLMGGGVQAISSAITPFTGDKVQQEDHRSEENLARLGQYAAEYTERHNRTWWDSAIDGLNRLPRPIMAFGVMGVFVWASIDPVRFSAAAQAWALIPEEMWIVLGAIVTFFFGDRTLLSLKKGKYVGPTPEQVQLVIATQQKIAAMLPMDDARYEAAMEDVAKPLSNDVIVEWNRRRQKATNAPG